MSNDNSNSTFNALVSGLEKEERLELLRRMKGSSTSESALLETHELPEEEGIKSLNIKFKKESFLIRLWYRLKALFSSTPVEQVYNEALVARLARSVQSNNPGLINYTHQFLDYSFYQKLFELRNAAKFFTPLISTYENNPGGFYVLLGSLVMPDIGEEMDKQADPYSYSLTKDVNNEMRTSLLRKMDDVLQKIPAEKKNIMYACVRSIEWLAILTKLPFEVFLSKFSSSIDSNKTCSFTLVENEIKEFANVLCHGHTIREEAIETLYLFSMRQPYSEDIEDVTSNDNGSNFMEKASTQLSVLSMFISNVPMRSLTRIVTDNALFLPEDFTGGEDWYVKYKSEWKRLFDCKWELWLRDCKKEKIKNKLTNFFLMGNFPMFPKRPWSTLWNGIPFNYELTLGFIYTFMKLNYVQYSQVLKTITLEGDFAIKDNRYEFSEAVNLFGLIDSQLDDFVTKLSETGEYGQIFKSCQEAKNKTKTSIQKIQSTMELISDRAKIIIKTFGEACRSILMLLRGFVAEEADPHFSLLANLTQIGGRDNAKFREDMDAAKIGISHGLELIKDIEPLDKPIITV